MKKFKNNKPLRSILIKPAGPDCNMACHYCFYLEKGELFSEKSRHRMNEKTLREMIKQVLASSEATVNFAWQGGEPTLMGLSFFKKAVEFQQKYGRGKVVGNGFQTNGILVDKEWAHFFRENKFLIGLSLDGPQHIHDRYRHFPNGNGTWEQVVASARLLLDEGVDVNALAVLNDYSGQYSQDIYHFFKTMGLPYMQFIPCVESDSRSADGVTAFTIRSKAFGEALCNLFDLWIGDFIGGRPTTSIRFFESLLFQYAGFSPPECTLLEECGNYIVVEHNGDVFSCDFFVEPRWHLGNLHRGQLMKMLNSERQGRFGRIKSRVSKKCRHCRWLPQCRGGCAKDRLTRGQDISTSYLCDGFKMFFKHAHGQLLNLAKTWAQKEVF